MKGAIQSATLVAVLAHLGCGGGSDSHDRGLGGADVAGACEPGTGLTPSDVVVNHEILQFLSPTEILVWASGTITSAEFDAVELPGGWFKNFPLQPNTDSVTIRRSPEAADNEIVQLEQFGYVWDHAVTVVEAGVPIEDGLLTRSTIVKHHDLMWEPCRTLTFLVSPEDESYVLTTQNAERAEEAPELPEGWRTVLYQTEEQLIVPLDGQVSSIQATNEQLFQGPVSGIPVAVE
jgi:hypothetical protein